MADDRLRVNGRIVRGGLNLTADLDLPQGVIAVVGPNGVGKTSLLRAISGLEPLAEGEIVLEGSVLDRRADRRFVAPELRDVSLAFQEPRLFPHRSVLGNITYPLERRRIPRAQAAEIARDIAARFGLEELSQRSPQYLSGGQAQRVSLARALAPKANTLLLDEPLASVDEESKELLRDRFLDSGSQRVLWVTHDPADAERADLIVSIKDGHVGQTAP